MKNSNSSANSTNQPRGIIIAIAVAVVVVVASLLMFMSANSERIVSQNAEYLQGSTGQTARRIEQLFHSSLEIVNTASKVYEETLTSVDVDPHEAVGKLEVNQFDQVFFISADGKAYSKDGQEASANHMDYYTEGMQGKSGISVVDNSLFNDENMLAFYSPVSYGNQIVGVLVYVYQSATLSQYMTTSYFGVQTPTYLCDFNGKIIAEATADQSNNDQNLFELFENEQIEGTDTETVEAQIVAEQQISFTSRTDEGIANTCITPLTDYDWIMVRIFPAEITNGMVSNANSAGLICLAGSLVAYAIVLIVILVQARRQKQQLLLERQEATRIIDASTNLFDRLLSIDLVNNSYEYLKSNGILEHVPPTGRHDELVEAWYSAIKALDENAEPHIIDAEALRHDLQAGVPYVQHESRILANGEPAWIQVSTLCLARDEQGGPTDVLVTVQDITETKNKEIRSREALEDAFNAAEHASQAKSDFLNSMSHDIRTPMNSIMGMTAIASMHAEEPERVRECLANITSASRHLLGLINEVLDMAKIESGKIDLVEEAFDLPETIENLITIVHPQITAKNLNLKVDLVDIKHEHVLGDPTRLQQVFVNIMGNAIKFTDPGGQITLGIAELPSRVSDSGCYQFTFADTGCGMSEEFVKTVFEPFARANDSRTTHVEGTGLGMAIVKSVVSMMNGTIDVESEEGVGTTFTVILHLKLRDNTDEDISDLKDIRVLVVDDDQNSCEGACALLEDIGMIPTYALSGAEGVAEVSNAQNRGEHYKAVILDWRMPGMSGIEAAKKIREVTSENVPIIIFSGYDWSMIEQEAREVGVDAFIAKPLFRSRLIQVMKELLNGEVHDADDDKSLLERCSYDDKRILLTEDNDMAAAIAEEIIGLTGAIVDRAENGQVAVEKMQDSEPGYYDIILMDIQMPVMNGYEATMAIRKMKDTRPDLGEIPIVALSADAFAEDVKHSHDAGMSDHMAKPLEIEPLVAMLNKWMPQ